MVHSKCVTLLTGCLMLSSSPRDFPSGASGAGCNLIPSLHFRKIPYTRLQVRSVLNGSHAKKIIVNFYLCLELCSVKLSSRSIYFLFSFNYTAKVIIDTRLSCCYESFCFLVSDVDNEMLYIAMEFVRVCIRVLCMLK